jgi:GR25 family glycosyltransferase involved in LPS biosynthesis
MEVKYDHVKNNTIIEDELSILINKSWLSISCCSIADYFVGKYLEIISSGSIIIGNINDHGRTIIENAFVEVNDNYSDELIKSIILYYLNNKDLLIYLSMKSNYKIKNYTYENYSNILYNICNSITNNSKSEYEYDNILNKKLNNIDKTSYDYKITNIQNNTEYIQNICQCSKCFVIRILKCGEYYFKSSNIININIQNEFISHYSNIYYDGNYYFYFNLIKPDCKLNLNMNNNINYYYIEKCNRFDINLYNKDTVIQYINIASFLSKGFKNPILTNYNNLSEYNLSNSPSFFYGMAYDDEFKVISNKSNLSIVIYTGGDIDINNKYSYDSIIKKINILKNMPNIRFISISSFISNTLKKLNIPYIYLPVMGINLNKFKPCVKGNSIYIYTNHIKETYGMDLFLKIMEKYKNINFLLCTHPAQYELAVKHNMTDIYKKLNIKVISNIDELIKIYKKCFLGLRLTKFDGLAATVQELGCMGIKSIHNGSTPSSLNYNNFDDICNLIDNEIKTIGTIDHNLSDKVKKFLKIDPIYFNENFYYNNINYYFSKIYILNLKKQDKKRRRIIKLMKKHNINNYRFFEAIDGYTEPHITDWKKYSLKPFDNAEKKLKRKKIGSAGVWGNLLSVRNILITAKKNNENRILFFEDDIILDNNFNKKFTENIRQVPSDWLIILLGASVNQINSSCKKINNNIYTCGKMLSGGFAICINSKIYDELINECNKFNNPFDSGPLDYVINKYYNYCYIMYPNIVICNVEESTLRTNVASMIKYSKIVKWELDNFDLKF